MSYSQYIGRPPYKLGLPEPKLFAAAVLPGAKSEVQGITLRSNMLSQSNKSFRQWSAPPRTELSVTGTVQARTERPSIRFVGEESQAVSRQK